MTRVHELSIDDAALLLLSAREQLTKGIVGQPAFLDGLLIALAAGGHVLIEGVPGLGKTRAVNLLSQVCDVSFRRLQFTPDLLPADVVGTRIFNREAGSFETVTGPVFANFVLADEVNRAPAKVQSALLEIMQERQVTIGKESLSVPLPFHVFATQNPVEQEGTYPLPEAQLDRFLVKLVVDYPAPDREADIVRMVIDETALPTLDQVLDGARIDAIQSAVRTVFIEDRVVGYATRLVHATRRPDEHVLDLAPYIGLGASPRGAIALAQAARASALLDGRDVALPDDVKSVARSVLRHRIIPTYYAESERVSTDWIVDQILDGVTAP